MSTKKGDHGEVKGEVGWTRSSLVCKVQNPKGKKRDLIPVQQRTSKDRRKGDVEKAQDFLTTRKGGKVREKGKLRKSESKTLPLGGLDRIHCYQELLKFTTGPRKVGGRADSRERENAPTTNRYPEGR